MLHKGKFLLPILVVMNVQAQTLKEDVVEVLQTNPIVLERLKNYRATKEDKSIANAEYMPTLNFRATAGYNNPGEIKDSIPTADYTNYETSLVLTQNLFNGFSTTNKVSYQEKRILASAYNYIEKVNDTAFEMTNAYLNVLRTSKLLETAQLNVEIIEGIYGKVKDLYEAGLTTNSEVKKIESSLSLAKSNLVVQQNNAHDAEYSYRRVLGRMPQTDAMQEPLLDVTMPESRQRASEYAIEHNPSMIVSRYNIEGAGYLMKQRKNGYYPTVDLEISQFLNDRSRQNPFDQQDDRFRARVVLNWNLFRGGTDSSEEQKQISKVHQEIEIKRDLKRQVIEGLDLSWDAYTFIASQLDFLREYKKHSEKTLELYQDEYDLGRRSLLDLLAAQNDVISSHNQLINAEYDYLFSKYRILDAMGLLVLAVTGDTKDIDAKVGINNDHDDIVDTLPVGYDVDNDKIPDNLDLCDNSLKADNIMPDGCRK